MCDKRTLAREKTNKQRRNQREIAKAMVREIQVYEQLADATSTDSSDAYQEIHSEASAEKGPHRVGCFEGQQESSDTEVLAQEQDEDIREHEHVDRRSDRTESVDESEETRSDRTESVDESEETRSDGSDSAAERAERAEYEELREWAIQCNIPQKNLDKLLDILRRRLLPNLPKSSKTFLKTNSCPYVINETATGQFVYFGIDNGLQACVVEALHPERDIFSQFNVDGIPILKSSAKQFWPLLCKVHCPQYDIYIPFIVACYCGDAKPTDLVHYFHDFTEEINTLQKDGIIINRKLYKVKVKCFICDSPAQALLKNVKGHGGFSACERCTVYGQRIRKNRGFCTVYPELDKPLRTNESFRNLDDPNHHNSISPLLDIVPPIDMVDMFLLDKMHLLDGGAMKKELECWIAGDLKTRLSRRSKAELDRRITSLRSQIPCEFQRKPRPSTYLAKWKCTEFRLFLLYIGPIVLRNVLPRELYKHFLLLHVAARILCSEDLALRYNNHAKIYLTKFVLASRRLYGGHFQSLNTHNLVHIPNDAKNMGCSLSCISAYPFESVLGKLKKLIRTANLPLPQVCRRIYEAQSIKIKRPIIPNEVEILKTKIDVNGIEQAIKVRYKSSILTDKAPDNIILLRDSTIIQIDEIIILRKNPDMVKIQGREWKKHNPVYNYPSDSKHVQAWELRRTVSPITGTCELNSILAKMIKISVSLHPDSVKKVYALSLLHK